MNELLISLDWFKGNFTGIPYISWESLWFPVDFPLNQASDNNVIDFYRHPKKKKKKNGPIRCCQPGCSRVVMNDDIYQPHLQLSHVSFLVGGFNPSEKY